jgi:hypothetical protein
MSGTDTGVSPGIQGESQAVLRAHLARLNERMVE